jgi:aldose 1-epimerase
MFKIDTRKFGEFNQVKLENVSSGESVVIIPEYGGCVNELLLSKDGDNYSVINGCETFEELIKNENYKSSKMFPFANRIPDGKYKFHGKNYQLPINWPQENHAIHGFIHDKNYTILEETTTENSAKLTIEYQYEGEYPGYPFPFLIILTFLLSEDDFKYTTEVENTGKSISPIMDGWHPYFKLACENINDLLLKIPAKQRTEIDERMIPTGKLLPLNNFSDYSKIGSTFFDTCFPLEVNEAIISTELYNQEKNVTFQFWQESGAQKYNFLQLYTPPDRQSIAIEPMSSNTNSFNTGDGLIILKPGEKFEASCGVKLV